MSDQKKEYEKQSVTVTGLWAKDGQYGPFMTGSIGFAQVMVTENTNRKGDNSPTHWLKFQTKQPKADTPPIDPVPVATAAGDLVGDLGDLGI